MELNYKLRKETKCYLPLTVFLVESFISIQPSLVG